MAFTSNWRRRLPASEVLQVGALRRCRRYGSAIDRKPNRALHQARLSLREVSSKPRLQAHTQALQLQRWLAQAATTSSPRACKLTAITPGRMPPVGAG